MEIKNINELKEKTYSWLNVNSLNLQIDEYQKNKKYDINISNPFKRLNKKGYKFNTEINIKEMFLNDLKNQKNKETYNLNYGASKEMLEETYNNSNSKFYIEIEENVKIAKPIVIDYTLDENNSVIIDCGYIKAKKNSRATVVLNYVYKENMLNNIKKDIKEYRNSMLHVYAEEGANIKVVKLQNLSDFAISIDSNVSIINSKATVKQVSIMLGGKISCENYKNFLINEDSKVELQTAYMGVLSSIIDLDYTITCDAKQTFGNIDTRGILADNSKKTFKGTLDFKEGCSMSKASEEERVMLLSDKAVSYAVPLLLCAEDDVEGAHAASSGKMDEEQLFYLTSRGLTKAEAKKAIVFGYFNEILENVNCKKTRNEIIEKINRRIG